MYYFLKTIKSSTRPQDDLDTVLHGESARHCKGHSSQCEAPPTSAELYSFNHQFSTMNQPCIPSISSFMIHIIYSLWMFAVNLCLYRMYCIQYNIANKCFLLLSQKVPESYNSVFRLKLGPGSKYYIICMRSKRISIGPNSCLCKICVVLFVLK